MNITHNEPKMQIQLSHTTLPDGYDDLKQWGNHFPVWDQQKQEEYENWLKTLVYNNKKAYD